MAMAAAGRRGGLLVWVRFVVGLGLRDVSQRAPRFPYAERRVPKAISVEPASQDREVAGLLSSGA
jgi:hypothetical protein